MDNLFTCAACGETYEKGWSDEEAEEEFHKLYGNIPMDKRAMICDDCHQKLVRYGHA